MNNSKLKISTRKVFVILCLVLLLSAKAQNIDTKYLTKQWNAAWVTVQGASPNGYGVYLFRKAFELKQIPAKFPIHVSADNRYRLYVNEKLVSMGPARGDIMHWNFETVDLTPYLQVGKNAITAQVWN